MFRVASGFTLTEVTGPSQDPHRTFKGPSQDPPPERPLIPLDVLPDAPDLVVEVGEDSAAATLGLVSHPGVLVLV